MGEKPPNWQWCQDISQQKREEYWHVAQRRAAIKRRQMFRIATFHFYDKLPPKVYDRAVCVIAANDRAEAELACVRDSIIQYAQRCNADYIELTGNQAQENWPMSNKYRVEQVTKVYDKTLYLDCDIAIKDNAPDLFECTPDDKISAYDEIEDFINQDWIVKEQQIIIGKLKDITYNCAPGRRMINGGVMVIPKSLSHYYSQPADPYPNIWCFDQHLLSMRLPAGQFYSLPKTFNTTWSSRKARRERQFLYHIAKGHFIHLND
jgi:hypothetical protein